MVLTLHQNVPRLSMLYIPIYKLTVVDTYIYIERERVIFAIKFAYTP